MGSRASSVLAAPDHRHEFQVDPVLASVGVARTAIRRALEGVPSDRAERAAVCGSELVANAVRHGFPPISLMVLDGADHVIVAVEDGNLQPPLPRRPGSTDPSGRGMLIVEKMADRWGVDFEAQAKRVWCLIDLQTD